MPINYKEYPPNWKTEIRPAVLARAGNRCEVCFVRNYAMIYRYGNGLGDWSYCESSVVPYGMKLIRVILTLAHLDRDKHNHEVSLDRLKAMCQRCHLAYDRPFNKIQTLKKQKREK